jgi:predicted kinase
MKIRELKESADYPEIIVMIGLPGVGKSTVIKRDYPNHTIVSSDDIIEKYAAEEGKTYDQVFQKYIGQASGEMKSVFRRAVQNNENIVWDQTNLSKKKRRGILSQVPRHYRKVAVVFDVSDKVRYERMAQREGKSIPAHVIQSMEKAYQAPTKDEGFDEIRVIKE